MIIFGKALFGSQNLHLDGPQSDKDYKLFVTPEFIDLYNGKNKFELPVGYEPGHNVLLDFRRFDTLLRKGNVNMIELLYSKELSIYDETFVSYFELARTAYENGYVSYAWDYYFHSAKGLIFNSLIRCKENEKVFRKGTSRALWMINFMTYLIENGYHITKDMWDCPQIYEHPRQLRYNDEVEFITEDRFEDALEKIEFIAKNTQCTYHTYLFQEYENQLRTCAQNTIKEAIKKELEER